MRQVENREPYYEMARVGTLLHKYEICVYENEGPIPHFHIWVGNPKSPDFECCVRIDEPRYFKHGVKQDELNSKLKKELIKYLHSVDEDEVDTEWEVIRKMWNRNNPQYRVSKKEIPDYDSL